MIMKNIAKKISFWNRTRKWNYFTQLFNANNHPKILDVGFTNSDGSGGMINTNWLEKYYPFLQDVTALGIEDSNLFRTAFPEVKAVTYDGNIFPFKDKEFDIVFCNAVLEHVGKKKNQIFFIKELVRTSKSICYFTTPNKYFPIELHSHVFFLHWFSKKFLDWFLMKINQPDKIGDYMNLLSYKDLKAILKEAGIQDYKIKKNKLLCFTLDFCVVISNLE